LLRWSFAPISKLDFIAELGDVAAAGDDIREVVFG